MLASWVFISIDINVPFLLPSCKLNGRSIMQLEAMKDTRNSGRLNLGSQTIDVCLMIIRSCMYICWPSALSLHILLLNYQRYSNFRMSCLSSQKAKWVLIHIWGLNLRFGIDFECRVFKSTRQCWCQPIVVWCNSECYKNCRSCYAEWRRANNVNFMWNLN